MKFSDYGDQLDNAGMYSEGQKHALKNKLMEAKNDPAQLRVLSQEIVKNPAQMEVLKKLDPAMYSMLRATLVGGFMPPPVSAPGGSAAIRAPIQSPQPFRLGSAPV